MTRRGVRGDDEKRGSEVMTRRGGQHTCCCVGHSDVIRSTPRQIGLESNRLVGVRLVFVRIVHCQVMTCQCEHDSGEYDGSMAVWEDVWQTK